MSPLPPRQLRPLLLPLILTTLATLGWGLRQTLAPSIEVESRSEPAGATHHQRLRDAQTTLSNLRQMTPLSDTADQPVMAFLNTDVRAHQPAAEPAASAPIPLVDYAAMNPGVVRIGQELRLVLGEEAHRVGASLPGGDVLTAVRSRSFTVQRPGVGKLVIQFGGA